MKTLPVNLDAPFEETLRVVLSLPKGTVIQRTGILQSGDIREEFTQPLREMGCSIDMLPKALRYGPPSDELITEALQALYTSKGIPGPATVPSYTEAFRLQCQRSRFFYLNTQANLLPTAQDRSDFAKGEARYCYETYDEQGHAMVA